MAREVSTAYKERRDSRVHLAFRVASGTTGRLADPALPVRLVSWEWQACKAMQDWRVRMEPQAQQVRVLPTVLPACPVQLARLVL